MPPKSPPSHHVHHRAGRQQGHGAAGANPATPARPPTGDAPLRSPVPGDGESIGDTGAPDRDAMAGDWTAGPASGAGRPGASARRAAAVGGATGASGHPAHGRARSPSTD